MSDAFVGTLAALVGYVVYALTQSGVIGLILTLGMVIAIASVVRKVWVPIENQVAIAGKMAQQ